MAEYIKREAAIKAIEKADYTLIASDADSCKADYLREIIESVPAADVAPVVHCKDCKYADTERRNATEKRYFNSILFCRNSNLCDDEPLAMWPDDFCSYGERRDGGAVDEV